MMPTDTDKSPTVGVCRHRHKVGLCRPTRQPPLRAVGVGRPTHAPTEGKRERLNGGNFGKAGKEGNKRYLENACTEDSRSPDTSLFKMKTKIEIPDFTGITRRQRA